MKKLLFIFLATTISLFGCGNPNVVNQSDRNAIAPTANGPIVFYVTNEANYPADKINAYVAAQNIQLQRDFYPHWGIQASVVNSPPPSDDSFSVNFMRDLSSLHHLYNGQLDNVHGTHILHRAYVNGRVTIPEGTSESTASHEVIETLTNPNNDPHGFEAADGVAPYGYNIPGDNEGFQNMSDFVFPNYFIPGSPGPWDFLGHVRQARTPAPGGVGIF
jgi:hypothetical protein